mgnify:CR=1 FL=1
MYNQLAISHSINNESILDPSIKCEGPITSTQAVPDGACDGQSSSDIKISIPDLSQIAPESQSLPSCSGISTPDFLN